MLHEAARHAIHSCETLNVLAETLEAIQQQHLNLSNKMLKSDKVNDMLIQVHIGAQIRILRNFSMRALSNKERLNNEISLVSTNFKHTILDI